MTSGIHFGAESWKSKFMRGEDTLGETEWRWHESNWLSSSNVIDETTTSSWSIDASDVSERSHYLKDFGVTVNDTTSVDVYVDVESHWKVIMSISAYDTETEVRDWVTVSVEVQGDLIVEQVLWNGNFVEEVTIDQSVPNQYFHHHWISPDGQWQFSQNIDTSTGVWNTAYENLIDRSGNPQFSQTMQFADGATTSSLTVNDNSVLDLSYVLSNISAWEPAKVRPHINTWGLNLLAAGVDGDTHNTVVYGVGAGALALAIAGACVFMKRKKDERKAFSDDFERV